MLGVLLIEKPAGITSHDVVNQVRRRLQTRRVGHAGTLDPMATGLLVVAVGPATRFLQYLPLEPKEYIGQIRFGVSTDSYDAEGNVTQERPVPSDLRERIREAVPSFKGLIQQLPPMHSAVKVKGKPLYHYARQGKELEREPRTVHIDTYEVISVEGDLAEIRIVCSGGTYIRSLAHDLGEAIGCGAHLCRLERTRVGRFALIDAHPLEEIKPEFLMPLAEALPPMPLVQLDEQQVRDIREGRAIAVETNPLHFVCALLAPEGNVVSVARVKGGMLHPDCVIPAEASDAAA